MARKLYTKKELKALGQSLIDHCARPDVFHLVQWTRHQKKCYDWWMQLTKKHPILLEYHKRAKEILGGKIVQLAFENGDTWAIRTFIPKYLKDVDEYIHNTLRKQLTIKAEVAKEAMIKDPEHPFWLSFEEFMRKQSVKSEKSS